ncbi:MAG: hydroxyacylglutathione hydrolase [Neomegalonema sp.]|nr:hydroxyacylglutathione hydrolase [Neomegalonema sp.]
MSTLDALEIHLVPVLTDNYAYILRDTDTETVGVVDPGEAEPVEAALTQLGWRPEWIILTHHHGDHIAGAERLAGGYNAKIAGAAADSKRLPPLDAAVTAETGWDFGGQTVEVIETPGHTIGHIAYHFPRARALFAGDTLFSLGCGRLFEGTAAQMWDSLSKLAELPPETRVYCGHEYTQNLAAFALTIDPNNPALRQRAEEVVQLRADDKPTIPTTIGKELATNPFLRAGEPSLKHALGMAEADAAAVFAEIRRRKDAA